MRNHTKASYSVTIHTDHTYVSWKSRRTYSYLCGPFKEKEGKCKVAIRKINSRISVRIVYGIR